MTISPENVLKREDFELLPGCWRNAVNFETCHRILKLFVSWWRTTDKVSTICISDDRRMMNYGYSQDFKSRRSTRASLIEAIIVHSPAIGLPAIRPEDISVMQIVNCVSVWMLRRDVCDIRWWCMRSGPSLVMWWLSDNCPHYYGCCHCPGSNIKCDMTSWTTLDTWTDHVFRVCKIPRRRVSPGP